MTSCRLCGFQGPLDPCTVACPVCGEAYEKISGYQVRAVDGTLFALSRGRTWCGDASPQQQRSQLGAQALTSGDGVGLLRGSYLNPELLALLQLVPEQQSRRKRAKEDAVRAAGSLTPARREDEGQTDLDVVYIRPRNDPTMQVLKGRYNTQPRVARAASMSALHRLAHPLTGYDSMKALAPKARLRRQESIERVLAREFTRGRPGGGELSGKPFNTARSTVDLSRSSRCRKNVRRSPCRSQILSEAHRTRLGLSVDAVHFKRSSTSTGSPAGRFPRHRVRVRDERRRSVSCESTRNPSTALTHTFTKQSGERRAKPNLRRKRVATMRSVNGWVKEADPASTRRQTSIERRILALRRPGDRRPRRAKNQNGHVGNSGSWRASREGDGTFLTELDTDDALCEAALEHGPSGVGGCAGGRGGRNAKVSEKNRNDKEDVESTSHPGPSATSEMSAIKQGSQARRMRGLGRQTSSKEAGRRGSELGKIMRNARMRRGRDGGAGGKYIGGLDHQRSLGRTRNKMASNEANGREQFLEKRGPTQLSHKVLITDTSSGNHDVEEFAAGRGSEGTTTGDHAELWRAPPALKVGESISLKGVVPKETAVSGHARALTPEGTLAPAWGAPRSYPVAFTGPESGLRLPPHDSAPQAEKKAAASRLRSAWQLLQGDVDDPASQATALLRSFQNKVPAEDQTTPDAPPFVSNTAGTEQKPSSPSDDAHRPLSGRDPSSTESSLAMMHRRPTSRSWVHRRCLPSLLTDTANSSSWKASIPTTTQASGPTRRRVKRRSSLDEPAGRMLRLDRNPVTVGDALGGVLSGNRRERDAEVSANTAMPDDSEVVGSVDVSARERGGVRPRSRSNNGGDPGRVLLSIPDAKPFLFVGGGRAYNSKK